MIKDLLSCFSFNFYIINNIRLLGCVNLIWKIVCTLSTANWKRRRIYKLHRISKKKNSKIFFFFKGKYFITHLQIFIYKYVHPIQQRVIITLIIFNDFPARTEIIKSILNVGPFYRHIFITNMKVNWKLKKCSITR